jgi:HlyD family secretion protein
MLNRAIAALSCLALLLGLCACQKPARATQATAPALSVQTAVVTEKQEPNCIELTGTVTGETSVALSTKLMSEITFLSVEEGARVKAGQVLARIDDADIKAMRSEAAAYRAEAAAALGEVRTVVAQGEAGQTQAEAAQNQAQAAYDDAKRDFERADRLAAEDSIPRSQRDKAELGMKIAQENLSRAKSAVKQAQAAVAQAKSKTPQIEAKQQQAAAKDTQVAAMQQYATITAPFDGVVSKKLFKQGQLSIPGQPLLVVEDVRNYRVQLAVPDNLLPDLKLGDAFDVVLDRADGQRSTQRGVLAVLGAAADPASHTVKVELKLASGAGVFSGQFARVLIPAGKKTTLSIPASAVVQDRDVAYVWRVSAGGVLAQCPVDTGPAQAGLAPVLHGLSPGDRIVVQPTPDLYAGAHVQGADAAAEAK